MFGAIASYSAVTALGVWTPLPQIAAVVGGIAAWAFVDEFLLGKSET